MSCDFKEKVTEMIDATGKLNTEVKKSNGFVNELVATAFQLNTLTDGIRNVTQSLTDFSKSGITLDSQMHDLSAVAGVTGDTLQLIEGYARASAKTFGTDATVAVEGSATNYQTLRVDALSDDYDLVSYEIRNKSC